MQMHSSTNASEVHICWYQFESIISNISDNSPVKPYDYHSFYKQYYVLWCTDGSVKLGVMEPGKETQQWMLLGNRLGMVSNPDLCLTIRDDSDAEGATIFATAFADKPSQQWEFVYL